MSEIMKMRKAITVSVVGVRGDGKRESVRMGEIRNVTHTKDGFIIIVYVDGKIRLYKNFIII